MEKYQAGVKTKVLMLRPRVNNRFTDLRNQACASILNGQSDGVSRT